MRREGWQHGTARSTADDDARAPSAAKPSNQSKFTGKCRRARCATCHSLPVSKSRDKAKGAHKLRSCDVALDPRLVSWRVAAAGEEDGAAGRSAHWSKYSGFSATGILDRLSERDYPEEEEEEEEEADVGESDDDVLLARCSDAKEEDDDGEEEEFCRVGIVWEYVDGEDWCLVHEM